jgi:hypothetical protein
MIPLSNYISSSKATKTQDKRSLNYELRLRAWASISVVQRSEKPECNVPALSIVIDDTILNKLILGMNESYKKTLQTILVLKLLGKRLPHCLQETQAI